MSIKKSGVSSLRRHPKNNLLVAGVQWWIGEEFALPQPKWRIYSPLSSLVLSLSIMGGTSGLEPETLPL